MRETFPPGVSVLVSLLPTRPTILSIVARLCLLTGSTVFAALSPAQAIDIEAHRGGRALFPENSPDPDHFIALLLELLQKENFADRVIVQSFDWRTLLLVQQRAPAIPTVYLTIQAGPTPTVTLDSRSVWTAGFDPLTHGGTVPAAIKAAGGSIWSPYYKDVSGESIAEAHQLGLTVVVWTVNKPDDMDAMIGLGVDGIISDRPDLLRQAAAKSGASLPLPTPVSP
jgi:glycerophosphoryl diester phosphodiesterase